MRESAVFFLALFGCLLASAGTTVAGELRAKRLRCEYLESPLGIDEKAPRLSWIVESSERGQKQSAYRILVASSRALLGAERGDLWDSGKVESSETVNVSYSGTALSSRAVCYWKVRVWDRDGKPSSWTEPSFWTLGLLGPGDWKAEYISYRDDTPVYKDRGGHFLPAARQYRKEFGIGKKVRRATIYATALGIYELHLNGQRVGDAYFAPGWTDYHQRAYYFTYDVTDQVRPGGNALGAWVADGWYSGYVGFGLLVGYGTEQVGRYTYGKTPAVMAQLEIDYTDGSREIIGTDTTWKVNGDGPIRQADFLMGEFYDARRETEGWTQPGYVDSAWESAIGAGSNAPVKVQFYEGRNREPRKIEPREVVLGFRRPPILEAFPGVPVRPTEEISVVKMSSPAEGVHIFDLGQNFAGSVRLKVKGPAGQRILLRFGEMLHPDGRLMTENLRKARVHDYYVLKGDPDGETYTPRFTFHGFQYVEVSGYPGTPSRDAITGIVLHSDTPFTSTFESSDPMVNRLFENVLWTQRANFIDLPTDCPQRDERMGWTGDAQAFVRTATFNADVAAFYTKWLRELMEAQHPYGAFPDYAPYPFQHGKGFGSAWGDAGIICPWTIYQVYGDTRIIRRCWEPMTRFLQWRKKTSRGDLGVVHGNEWGDWLAVNETTPLDYIDTIYYAYTTQLMAEMAEAIDKREEAAEYRSLWSRIQAAFEKKYLRPGGELVVDTQTAYALALFVGLVPEDARDAAGAKLAAKIRKNGNRMATGFLGTRPLLPVLSSVGEDDLAAVLLQSREFPSWGYEIEQGATTIWERWDSYTKEDGFGKHNAAMNSFSHYAFGAVFEWVFSHLGGIDTDGPGYKKLRIRPSPPSPGSNPRQEPIHWLKTSYDSIRGRITVAWRRQGNRFSLDATIPANTTATVVLPADSSTQISESDRGLEEADGVSFLHVKEGRTHLAVESGSYHFVVEN